MIDGLGRPVVLRRLDLRRLLVLRKGCNRPVVLNYTAVPRPVANLMSTDHGCFFMTQVWDLLVLESNAYGTRIIPNSWIDTQGSK